MSNDLKRIRKQQIHSGVYNSWNFRGGDDFSAFTPDKVLAGDNWECIALSNVFLDNGNVFIRPGDLVIAQVNEPGELIKVNIDNKNWKIFRNLSDEEVTNIIDGQGLVQVAELVVDTSPEGNYDTVTKYLTIADFADKPFAEGDNINMYINGVKYTTTTFTFQEGSNVIVWIPINAGFDLQNGMFIEIEVFR